jgi:hypothetical protein
VCVEVDFTTDEFILIFDGHHRVVASLLDDALAHAYLKTRPTVYLDQGHWSALPFHLSGSKTLSGADKAAAERLVELARAGRVVLPLASAHLLETSPLGGDTRRSIALTMLELCGGWFMRDPLEVRYMELVASMTGQSQVAGDVFGTAPGALNRGLLQSPPPDFPPLLAWLYARTLEVLAVYHTMAENSPLPKTVADLSASIKWVEANQNAGQAAHDQNLSLEQTRKFAHGRFLVDLTTEVSEAASVSGLDTEQFDAWLKSSYAAISKLPMLAHYREVLFRRIRNYDERWHPNDLVDMLYLSCGAGYADIVIGEKRISHYLTKASAHVPTGAFVTRLLTDAVEHLDRLLIAAP